MGKHPLAGHPAPDSILENIPRLVSAYYRFKPDFENPAERVSFGTSGHRGSSLQRAFNESHILAITQAICEFRRSQGIDGPLYLGMDTHALSEPAHMTALEVLAANEIETFIDKDSGYTPTPVVSHSILNFNRSHAYRRADGIVITPSHNPPEDGGFKYNPPNGGPADTEITNWIESRANQLMRESLHGVRRIPYEQALKTSHIQPYDYLNAYVSELDQVVRMDAIASSGLRLGVDPMGGSGIAYWEPIADRYGLNIEVVNERIDPTFRFMSVDHDGRIRMDCSSPWAMAGLIGLKDRFDLAFGNDTDYDRHGIVTPDGGLMNPNAYLSVAVWYLFQNRPCWEEDVAVGKTLVSSSLIERVSQSMGRKVLEVPVGFKWFVDGLLSGSLGFAGEESAGASFLRLSGGVWTTDKDGFILDLLAAEMKAVTEKDPAEIFDQLCREHGTPIYERIDVSSTPEQKELLKSLSAGALEASELAGEPILAKLTRAPGNDAEIGGLKVVAKSGWFAARPSGTEDVYKIYAESFRDRDHLNRIQNEAKELVQKLFESDGA
ncbi:MAG TPA: phosphoglucomutase (alpha-D-glucose-1,6-bisphosphate-dependent) [Acidobacteriota bacterium]|nr:phosphoglucomutase (alpha-D-glucose-1,6-bisphosphate-dependent) [Acidobacteriota bacterium]